MFCFRSRAEKLVGLFDTYLGNGQKIIDIGAGSCLVAREISKKGVQIVPVDVIDYNRTDLDLIIYDGEHLPFGDNSFDISLLLFTLHHCDFPVRVLKESVRVSEKIVVMEDIYYSEKEKFFLKMWDFITNLFASENMPYNFRNKKEWRALFKELGLIVLEEKDFVSLGGLINHSLFILRKEALTS